MNPGTLYVVGTPLGNLGDLTFRALETLKTVDFIAAEDTRITARLLNHFELKKPLVSYFEHNRRERGEEVLARLLAGENAALVTDAGMPAISDPGEDLVRLCREHEVPVAAVPGPCAIATALAVSGMPSARFTFEGFLSTGGKSRREHLTALQSEPRTIILYEAPHKLSRTLSDLEKALGKERKIAIVRELTKIHEEVIVTTLAEAVIRYTEEKPRGEFVLVIEGTAKETAPAMDLNSAAALAESYLAEGLSRPEAAKKAAAAGGFSKSEIYKLISPD